MPVSVIVNGVWMQRRKDGRTYRFVSYAKPERKAEIIRLYVDEQLSTYQIAAQFGISANAVLTYLTRAGIPRRPAHRRKST